MDSTVFLHAIEETQPRMVDRAVALLWLHENGSVESVVSLQTLCDEIEAAGFAKQNKSRFKDALKKDKRILTKKDDCFKLNAKHKVEVESQYAGYSKIRKIQESNSVLPTDLFSQSRGYIQRVVVQLNASYDFGLFDCAAVMCRRLLETLIIEAYEHSREGEVIKGSDGHYLMLQGLMTQLTESCPFQLGRNSMKGLRDYKSLGDLSAHNRRFNARKSDLDKVRDGLRVVCEELLHVANQGPVD